MFQLLLQPEPPTITQAEALHWILVNRRPEVAFEQALDTLRIALLGDTIAQQTLDYLATEWQHTTAALERMPVQSREADLFCPTCNELLLLSQLS